MSFMGWITSWSIWTTLLWPLNLFTRIIKPIWLRHIWEGTVPVDLESFTSGNIAGFDPHGLKVTQTVLVTFKDSVVSASSRSIHGTRLFIFQLEKQQKRIDLPAIFIAKPFRDDNESELWCYEQLKTCQGQVVPWCYGKIMWQSASSEPCSGIAIEALNGFRPLQPSDINNTFYSQCELAIDTLSANNILHADIKPNNILLHPITKSIRFIDFEYSKEVTEEWIQDAKRDAGETPSIRDQNLIDLRALCRQMIAGNQNANSGYE